MSDPAASPTTDLKDTLEEMRASVAARGARKGLRGAIQEAIFSLLEVLLGLLADFRAGRLAPVAEDAADGGDCTVAHPTARPTGSILGSSPRTVASLPVKGEREEATMLGKRTLRRASMRPRRLKTVSCTKPAAFAAVAGCARYSPRSPAVQFVTPGAEVGPFLKIGVWPEGSRTSQLFQHENEAPGPGVIRKIIPVIYLTPHGLSI